ncbi:YOR066W [Saccharomyces arboricola H-6]|uniref:YOR066W n=1 Tax=Saccharomyces arboricola (strain H-6 / AS 2.3317 / CBS 10644) TaxID=1160507 RepID=J8PHV6_SACAR|nr:YOR066W [Saccharomyces arboricola H-6]
MDKSMIKKRGRPPITKDYPNPLQSPMAHSSMQVQKQGPRSFAKPLMKVGQCSPSPNKRRLSVDHHHNLAATTRKGRYRGVLLSTPTKKSGTRGSTPISTPSSNDSYSNTIFSESRKTFLQSSPPIMSSSPGFQKRNDCMFPGPDQFKLSLTITESGKAVIAGSPPFSPLSKATHPLMKNSNRKLLHSEKIVKSDKKTVPKFEKKRILSLLRQMKNDKDCNMFSEIYPLKSGKSDIVDTELPTIIETSASPVNGNRNINVLLPHQPQSPPPSAQLIPPSTPKSSLQFRTGFTPNIALNQVSFNDTLIKPATNGMGSNNNNNNNNNNKDQTNIPANNTMADANTLLTLTNSPGIFLSPRNKMLPKSTTMSNEQHQEFVFKFSGGDPLLLTDDADGNWPEMLFNLSNTPRRQKCFNTPPSWVNFGSPGLFSPPRSSNVMTNSATTTTASDNGNVHRQLQAQLEAQVQVQSQSNSPGQRQQQQRQFQMLPPHINMSSSPPQINIASPPHQSPARRSPTYFNKEKTTMGTTNMPSNTKGGNLQPPAKLINAVHGPSTPRNQELQLPTLVGCTPLIQQTMNGSLGTKYIPETSISNNIATNLNGFTASNVKTASGFNDSLKQNSFNNKQDDARTALKKLIDDQ